MLLFVKSFKKNIPKNTPSLKVPKNQYLELKMLKGKRESIVIILLSYQGIMRNPQTKVCIALVHLAKKRNY